MTRKVFAWTAALLLLVISGFHMTGLPMVRNSIPDIENLFMQAALEPVWITPSIHWFVFALIIILSAVRPQIVFRPVLGLIGIAVIIDAFLIAFHVGFFIGAILLFVAGVLTILSAVLRKPNLV